MFSWGILLLRYLIFFFEVTIIVHEVEFRFWLKYTGCRLWCDSFFPCL